MYIFVDEAGDLGKRGTPYFLIMLVATERVRSIEQVVRSILKRFPAKRRPKELKGAELSLRLYQYFCCRMSEVPCRLISVLLDKAKLGHKEADWLVYARMLCEGLKVLEGSFPLHIEIDRRFSRREFEELRAYVMGFIAGRYGTSVRVELRQIASEQSKGVQAADVIAYGVFQKYAYGEEERFLLFSERLEVVELP